MLRKAGLLVFGALSLVQCARPRAQPVHTSTGLLAAWKAQAHTIDLAAATKECFFEDLHGEDKASLPCSLRLSG